MIIKKKKLRKARMTNFIISVFLVLFVLGFVLMLISSNLKLKERRSEVLRKIEETKKEIQRLEKEKEALRDKVLERESKDYLEKEARERFNLKKPGEEVAIIVEPEEGLPSLTPSEKKEKSFWQGLLEFFQKL